jgi:transposase-like protein
LSDFRDQSVVEKESARSQTLEQLAERRKQVVRLYRQGTKIMQIVTMTGLIKLDALSRTRAQEGVQNFV